jgi:hypothetical protein
MPTKTTMLDNWGTRQEILDIFSKNSTKKYTRLSGNSVQEVEKFLKHVLTEHAKIHETTLKKTLKINAADLQAVLASKTQVEFEKKDMERKAKEPVHPIGCLEL